MNEAELYLNTGIAAMDKNPLAIQLRPMAELVQGHLFLTEGDFTQAEQHFSQVRNQADSYQEGLIAAEAILGQAQARLARRELEAAQNTFLAAGRQFQLLETGDSYTPNNTRQAA